MSGLERPEPVLFFLSWIALKGSEGETTSLLSKFFSGVSETFYPEYNPSLDYYAKEMGDKRKLVRGLSFFQDPIDRERLLDAKLWCQKQEEKFQEAGARTFNFDPGFLALEQMVLATGKKYSHRLYLGQGVYAELCLQFQSGSYQALPWTYPDYLEPKKLAFFMKMRKHLKHIR